MAQLKTKEKPVVKSRSFKRGDFAQCKLNDDTNAYGIITLVEPSQLSGVHFEYGFGTVFTINLQYNQARKVKRDEAMTHFQSIADALDSKIDEAGLSGAVVARKHYQLTETINNLNKAGINPYIALSMPIDEPGTGIYVLQGLYSGQGPGRHMELLAASPRLNEDQVTAIMKRIQPKGFGEIPGEIFNTPATSHGHIVGYDVYEVPRDALIVIGKRPSITLEDQAKRWRLIEAFPKD